MDIDTSGRYDSYSTSAEKFSPKIGLKFKPVQQFMVRATYSTGFRIPSFAETGAAPTTGYVTYIAPTSFQALHNNDGYGSTTSSYSVGQVSVSNPNLKPETSTNFTGGVVWEPTHSLSFTLDYFRIEKKNVIVEASCFDDALKAYYASNGATTSSGLCTVRPGIAFELPQLAADRQLRHDAVRQRATRSWWMASTSRPPGASTSSAMAG